MHRRLGLVLLVAAVVYALDQIAKALVVAHLQEDVPVDVVPHVLDLRLIRNPGAAFGIGTGATVVFTLIAAAVVVVILRVARRLTSAGWAVALGLLLGGAVGNLTDRLVRSPGVLRGHVVDFLELPHWPIFNLADSSIVCGGILLVLLSLRGVPLERSGADHSDGRSPGAAATADLDTDQDADQDASRREPGR